MELQMTIIITILAINKKKEAHMSKDQCYIHASAIRSACFRDAHVLQQEIKYV